MLPLVGFIKNRLAAGLLCCLVLVAAYLFQLYFSDAYTDALSSSIYFSTWLTLFVGALLWTFRERNTQMLPFDVTDWQFIVVLLLITSDQIYIILLKGFRQEVALALSNYTLPALVVGSIVIAVLIKLLISLYRLLDNERRQSALQTQRLQSLLASPLSVQKNNCFVRRLIINESIFQLSAADYLLLVEECRTVDPDFFVWLKERNIELPPRDIVWCILVRMQKRREEIISILGVTDNTYRTMLSRFRKRLCVRDVDLETFLKKL